MKRNPIRSVLITAALLLSANLAPAAENKPGTPAETKAVSAPKASEKSAKAAKAAAVKLVDINSASKAELKTLPGIGDAEADKIIAGRPYGSKSHLFTRNIVSGVVYDNVKARVIAMQKGTPVPKSGQK